MLSVLYFKGYAMNAQLFFSLPVILIAMLSCQFIPAWARVGGSPEGAAYYAPPAVSGHVFEVGPGRRFAEIAEVPWLALAAGDMVLIYYRPVPYAGIIGLRCQGTAPAPSCRK